MPSPVYWKEIYRQLRMDPRLYDWKAKQLAPVYGVSRDFIYKARKKYRAENEQA